MELFEKIANFLKKKPSKAELERISKQKADKDRARMEDIRSRITAAGAGVSKLKLDPDDEAEIRRYFAQVAQCADNVGVQGFDVEKIDRYISGIVNVLERAVRENGSKETLLRCFQGIVYGLINAHSDIAETADELDIVRRREEMTDRYLRIAQFSLEIDKQRAEVSRLQEKQKLINEQYEAAFAELQKLIDENASVWSRLQELIPSERDQLDGTAKVMHASEQRTINLNHTDRNLSLMIGHRTTQIVALENTANQISMQLQSWESNIDEKTMADVIELSEAFKRDIVAGQKQIDDLNRDAEKANKILDEALLSNSVIEDMIVTQHKYEEMLADKQRKEQEDIAGRTRLLKERLEKEKEMNRLLNEQEELLKAEEQEEMSMNEADMLVY